MPFTFKLFRQGKIEISEVFPENDDIFEIYPKYENSKNSQNLKFGKHPALLIELPFIGENMLMFFIGDPRLNSWVITSGVTVIMPDNDRDYRFHITPLPGDYCHCPTYSTNQAFTNVKFDLHGHFRLPINFHFSNLSTKSDYIMIQKGTPIVQYLLCTIPKVSLQLEPPNGSPFQCTKDIYIKARDYEITTIADPNFFSYQ